MLRIRSMLVLFASALLASAATKNLNAQTISSFTLQDQSTPSFNQNNGTRFAEFGSHLTGGYWSSPPPNLVAYFSSGLTLDVEGWGGTASTTAATSRFTATIHVADEFHCGWKLRFVGRRKGQFRIQHDKGSSHAEVHALAVVWSRGPTSGTLDLPEVDSGSHGDRQDDYVQNFDQSSTATLSGSGTEVVTLTIAWDTYASCDPGFHAMADAPPIQVDFGDFFTNPGYKLDVTFQTCTIHGGPSAAASSVPPFVPLNANGSCCYDAIVRDSTGAGIPYAPVVLSFSGCDITFCEDQNPGVTVDPVAKTATALADGLGQVHFCICGNFTPGCVATLLSDGVLVGTSPVQPCPQIPRIKNGYAVAANKYRIVFDVEITPSSAINTSNYSLASLGQVTSAVTDGPSAVILSVADTGLSAGQPETVTVNGVVSSPDGVALNTPVSVTFLAGVLTIAELRAPDPDSLAAVPCVDRSRFAGPGSAQGPRLTTYGIATSSGCLQDEAGGPRSGVEIFFSRTPLVPGHHYLMAGALDTRTGKTGFWDPVYLRDDGVGTMPSSPKWPLTTLLDATCDAGQSSTTSDDLLGGLVTADSVVVSGRGSWGDDFLVGPYDKYANTMRVENDGSSASYTPVTGQLLRVTGALRSITGHRFEIQPRDSTDIVVLGMTTTGVHEGEDVAPVNILSQNRPNPFNPRTQIGYSLARGGRVRVQIFDVSGRLVRRLVDKTQRAGAYEVSWDGRTDQGTQVESGMYFYRVVYPEGNIAAKRMTILR